jgi:hypothetical protein
MPKVHDYIESQYQSMIIARREDAAPISFSALGERKHKETSWHCEQFCDLCL